MRNSRGRRWGGLATTLTITVGVVLVMEGARWILARRRAHRETSLAGAVAANGLLLANCVERLDDYDTALSIIGNGMMGHRPARARTHLRSVACGEAAGEGERAS